VNAIQPNQIYQSAFAFCESGFFYDSTMS